MQIGGAILDALEYVGSVQDFEAKLELFVRCEHVDRVRSRVNVIEVDHQMIQPDLSRRCRPVLLRHVRTIFIR